MEPPLPSSDALEAAPEVTLPTQPARYVRMRSLYAPWAFRAMHGAYSSALYVGTKYHNWRYADYQSRAIQQPYFAEASAYKFDPQSHQWKQFFMGPESTPHAVNGCELKIATYNVLNASPLGEWLVASPERYEYQMDILLPALDADVITLNEVSSVYLDALLQKEWVRKDYYITEMNPSNFENRRNGRSVVVLSRFPMVEVWRQWTGILSALVTLQVAEGKHIQVCACHLSAFASNVAVRKTEWDFVTGTCSKTLPVILLGDLNLHHEAEQETIQAPYQDAWKVLRGDDPGYTWDAGTNPLINAILPYDPRRMRLDRITWKAGDSLALCPISIDIFARDPIFDSATAGVYNFMRASDHYGLVAKFTF